MVYADYEYYTSNYKGTAIPKPAFDRIVRQASQRIDYFTFNRITKEQAADYKALSDCACDMAETLYSITGDTGIEKEKKSENTDGYSVTYVTNSDGNTEDAMTRKLYSIARLYLSQTGLLYAGC